MRTRLEEAPLRDIAEMTHGVYFPAYTRTLPLGQVYINAIAGQSRREESDDALPVYAPALSVVLGGRFRLHGAGGRDRRPSPRHGSDRRNRRPGLFHCTSEGAMNNRLSKICLILFGCIERVGRIVARIGRRCCDKATRPTLAATTRRRRPGMIRPATARPIRDSSRLTWRRRNIVWLWRRTRIAPGLAREAEQSYRCCIAPEIHGERRRCTVSAMLSYCGRTATTPTR